MVKTLPDGSDASNGGAYKCVADIRNTGKISKILIKYLHRILHVYIDTNEGAGYKFCLAVKLEDDFKDHHLAFTAATGQVADNHDILEITTRYLKQSDRDFDDSTLKAMSGGGSHHSSFYTLYWLIMSALAASVTAIAGFQLYTYHTLSIARIDLVQICSKLNPLVLPHYALHAAMTLLLLLGGAYYSFLLNLPLLGWRIFEFVKKNFLFSPANLGPSKGHAANSKSIYLKLGGSGAIYAVCTLYFLWQMLFA